VTLWTSEACGRRNLRPKGAREDCPGCEAPSTRRAWTETIGRVRLWAKRLGWDGACALGAQCAAAVGGTRQPSADLSLEELRQVQNHLPLSEGASDVQMGSRCRVRHHGPTTFKWGRSGAKGGCPKGCDWSEPGRVRAQRVGNRAKRFRRAWVQNGAGRGSKPRLLVLIDGRYRHTAAVCRGVFWEPGT